jgi:DedD protein
MAFFKFRKDSDDHPAPAPAPESVETMRRRARYRLVGASILVLAGVIGFPLLFDNQPRPIAVDIPIEIPDKTKAQGTDVTAKPVARDAAARVASGVVAGASVPLVASSTQVADSKPAPKADKSEEIIASSPPAAKPEVKTEPKPSAKPETKANAVPDTKPADKNAASAADAAKARALLDGKPADKPADKAVDKAVTADGIRYIVQFGAFTDPAKAHETRLKVEKTGLKTYAQAVQTPEGKKFRVRVGPFEHKSDAEKAAEKIKKLDLPAAILEL